MKVFTRLSILAAVLALVSAGPAFAQTPPAPIGVTAGSALEFDSPDHPSVQTYHISIYAQGATAPQSGFDVPAAILAQTVSTAPTCTGCPHLRLVFSQAPTLIGLPIGQIFSMTVDPIGAGGLDGGPSAPSDFFGRAPAVVVHLTIKP